jgi:hypothetical protein
MSFQFTAVTMWTGQTEAICKIAQLNSSVNFQFTAAVDRRQVLEVQ